LFLIPAASREPELLEFNPGTEATITLADERERLVA
jgi:hypothetical protein